MNETTSRKMLNSLGARAVLVVLLLSALALGLRWISQSGLLPMALDWIRHLGGWGPVMFVVIYILVVLLFVPASILTLGAGFVFGLGWGSFWVLLAATLSANVNFFVARYLARDWVSNRIAQLPKFRAIDEAVAREGWKMVALIRLAPIFPYSVMSYAFGLTKISWRAYFLANFSMVPATLMYVYFGSVLSDLSQPVERPPWLKWLIGGVTVVVVAYVTRFARRALRQRID